MSDRYSRATHDDTYVGDSPGRRAASRLDSVVNLSARNLLQFLALAVLIILVLHLTLQLLPIDFTGIGPLRDKLDVDNERSLPTYLASALLTICGMLCLWLARVERLPWPGWTFLAVAFVGAGIDEVATIHEELNFPLAAALELGGWLRFAWVIVGAAVALIVAAVFLRAFLALPTRVRFGLAAGATLFLLGAVGMELPGGRLSESLGFESWQYILVSTLEEALEFAGVLVWLRVLVRHMQNIAPDTSFRLNWD